MCVFGVSPRPFKCTFPNNTYICLLWKWQGVTPEVHLEPPNLLSAFHTFALHAIAVAPVSAFHTFASHAIAVAPERVLLPPNLISAFYAFAKAPEMVHLNSYMYCRECVFLVCLLGPSNAHFQIIHI